MFWKITTVVLIVVLAVLAFKGNNSSAPTGGTVADNPEPAAAVNFGRLIR